MAVRFRKSVKLGGGVKLNLNKKSVGISAGVKGARVSVNSSGRKTTTVGIPGTGISYSKTTMNHTQMQDSGASYTNATLPAGYNGLIAFLLTALGVILVVLCVIIVLVVPPVGVLGIILGVFCIRYGHVIRKRIRQVREESVSHADNGSTLE